MPQDNYRYYCLDSAGKLHDAHWFNAESDEEALAFVAARHRDGKCEIWEGDRLVASLAPNSTNRALADSYASLSNARRVLGATANLVNQQQSQG